MKSTLHLPSVKTEKLKFPLLARQRRGEYVVWFFGIRNGIVVFVDPNNACAVELGFYSGSWDNVDDESTWEILPIGSEVHIKQ